MSGFVVDNVEFDHKVGMRVLRMKHREIPASIKGRHFVSGSKVMETDKAWEEATPMSFAEIGAIKNLEQRRIAFKYLDMEALVNGSKVKKEASETLKKKTTWVNPEGKLENHEFEDTYELWSIDATDLIGSNRRSMRFYYVRMKDTSTDREYMIWVDRDDVARVNNTNNPSPIACIAWTIQTTVPAASVKRIIRQGDCILVEPKAEHVEKLEKNKAKAQQRHLTEQEYRKLLELES